MKVQSLHIMLLICLLFSGILSAQETATKKLKYAESLIVKDPEKARKIALDLYQNETDDQLKLQTLFVLTNTSNLSGKPIDAIQYGNDALELAKEQKNELLQIKIYGLLGNLYQSIPLNEKTKDYLNKAEKLIETSKLPDSLDYIKGNIYYLKGMNYTNTLDCEMAVNYFNRAIQIYSNSKHPLAIINLKLAYLNKGFCDIDLGKTEEAKKMLSLSRVENATPEALQPPLSAGFMKAQNIYADFGEAKLLAAKGDVKQSNSILEHLLAKNPPEMLSVIISDVYDQLVQNYLKLGNIEQSKKYEIFHLQEVKKREEFQKKLLDTLIQHEKKINEENNKKIFKKYLFSTLLISAFGLVILSFLISKIKKTSQKNRNLLNESEK